MNSQIMNSPLSDPGIIPDPYPIYAELAEREPIHWCEGLKGWALMRHADCASALKDSRLKADPTQSTFGVKFGDSALSADSIYYRFTKNVMLFTDPPLHTSLRRSAQPAFTLAANKHYSEIIRQVASDLVGEIPNGKTEIDAAVDLAAKVSVRAGVRVLGVPEEDLDYVLPRVHTVLTYWSGPKAQPISLDQILQELTELNAYTLEMVRGERGKVLPDTMVGRLVAADNRTSGTTLDQMIHQLVLIFLTFFSLTNRGSLGTGMLSFATHRDQIERFLTDPACAANTANEVFRHHAANQYTSRMAGTAVEIGGVEIKEGELVIHFWPPPTAIRNSVQHLSFGAGPHSCIGRQFANLEVNWFFVALFKRLRRIRLAGEPVWNTNLEFRCIESLALSIS